MKKAQHVHVLLGAMALTLAAGPVFAAGCSPTPALPVQHYPGAANINPGNNLRLPAGKAVEADGQRVVIRGQLLDAACVPVPDARIELWQVDPFGKWMLASPEDMVSAGPVFTGAGRARTMNDGSFDFITSFPAAVEKRAPHFDLRIYVEGQKDFSTALYFADDGRNASDPLFNKLKPEEKHRVSMQVNEGADGLDAVATIVLPYKLPYRGY